MAKRDISPSSFKFQTILFSLISFIILLSSAHAASVCYDDRDYPVVYDLEATQTGFVAQLGGKFVSPPPEVRMADTVIQSPSLIFQTGVGWRQGEIQTCTGYNCNEKRDQKPDPVIPHPGFSRNEAISLRPEIRYAGDIDQSITSWTTYGDWIWFGLGFYSGEGLSGVGGIGRYNSKTEALQVRPLKQIRDHSVSPIFHDGKYLWLGTYGSYECIGAPPYGLVRYDWDANLIESFSNKENFPCGLLIHDFLKQGDILWVATDLGLSRWDEKRKKWDNYLPDPKRPPFMKPITCLTLYTTLLDTIPEDSFLGDYNSHGDLLWNLFYYQPETIKQYIASKSPKTWKCIHLNVLGATLKEGHELGHPLIVKAMDTPHWDCLVASLEHKIKDTPEWQRFLLMLIDKLENSTPEDIYLHFDIFQVFDILKGNTTIGSRILNQIQAKNLPFYEFELLAVLYGRKSVPILIESMDRFKDHEEILHPIIKSLEKITGTDLTEYQDNVVTQWKAWWQNHKAEYPLRPEQPDALKD